LQPQELYELWTPPLATWSPWVKPVLFAHLVNTAPPEEEARVLDAARGMSLDWAPRAGDGCGIVLDLPGAEPIVMGLALALRGYQPVLLFNTTPGPGALVDLNDPFRALRQSGAVMREARLDPGSPPAFLLDSRRMRGQSRPKVYDNRWMTFPQDFPSGAALVRNGVREMLLVLDEPGRPADDLRHVLVRWQEAGVALSSANAYAREAARQPITVTKPFGLRLMCLRALTLLKLRRNSAGGFGGIVPEPSQGGGSFG
jgi:hypothetical protein